MHHRVQNTRIMGVYERPQSTIKVVADLLLCQEGYHGKLYRDVSKRCRPARKELPYSDYKAPKTSICDAGAGDLDGSEWVSIL